MKYSNKLFAIPLSFLLSFSSMAVLISPDVQAASRSFNFSESTSQTQTHTVSLPNLKSITSISTNTGTASVQSINGDNATIRLSGGTASRTVQTGGSAADSKIVTNQTTANYNIGGYTGTLSSYLHSGSYTPSDTRYVTDQSTSFYNSNGYSGTLTQYVKSGTYTPPSSYTHTISYYYCPPEDSAWGTFISGYDRGDGFMTCTYRKSTPESDTRVYAYQGNVIKPASDTRIYRYEGTVYKPDTRTYQHYYEYSITVDYVDNAAPILIVTNTSKTASPVSGYNVVTLQGTVRDADNNPVTISATINGKYKSTIVNSTSTTREWTISWNVASDNISEGIYSNFVVQANDGQGGVANSTYTGSILVDRTKPTVAFTPESIEATFKDLEVQLALADTGGSGYKQVRHIWTKDETRPTEGWSDWEATNTPLIKQEKGGKWYLHIEALDRVGNNTYAYSGIYEKIVVSGGPSVNINVFPTPTGVWHNQLIDAYIMESGDAEVLAKAKKTYEVTNSPLYPSTFTKTIPTDKKIQLSLQGENFVHIQYVLDDGTKISATAGPYLIDTSAVGDFDMKLVNTLGTQVTDWTKETVTLVIIDATASSVSGFEKQYRIEGMHTDWQSYKAGTQIDLEGQHRIFGRIVNKTGNVSLQKVVVAKIDRTNPEITSLKLVKNTNGTYDVSVKAEDQLTGIQSVRLNTGLTLTANKNLFTASDLTTKPTDVTVQDQAGNTLKNTPFVAEPSIAFNAPYTTNLEVFREDVIANLSGATGYLIGNKGYACSTDPCQVTLSHNTTLTAVRAEGAKETRVAVKIDNIDKTAVQLLLNGKRNATSPLKIEFKWNYSLSGGTITCAEDGNTVNYTVSGTSYVLNGKNYTYHCTLTGVYKGETLTSNTVVIYADGKIPAEGTSTVPTGKVTTNVYLMETKLGKGYIINAKSDNYKYNELPLPVNEITKN